ncbi:DUF4231 domain-containing protein [Streptomyces sp. ISL-94]|uniref:DUF4231 domain-containing protein n=1 Tax=Streptomyces sp. ISL-94 TaxID=2819190 RepID=UPI001BE5EF68|nr:SLATT domain-containing protein [Streptomyces sp. ISL-94]MBT2480798.1 SLATT domain-containing protein [Streptomyces sp. ISL-94]
MFEIRKNQVADRSLGQVNFRCTPGGYHPVASFTTGSLSVAPGATYRTPRPPPQGGSPAVPDSTPPTDHPPASGADAYAPWVFAILERLKYGEQVLTREDAFKPCPAADPPITWGDVEVFLATAFMADVEWLKPWFVYPHTADPTRAVVRYNHRDGGESVWKGVRIRKHLPTVRVPTWGDVISHVLTSMAALYQTVPDTRKSPRGIATVSDPDHYPQAGPEGNNETDPEDYVIEDDDQEDEEGAALEGAAIEIGGTAGSSADYEPWVFEIIEQLKHNGLNLERDAAFIPYPGPVDWRVIDDFLSADGMDAYYELHPNKSWRVYPDRRNPKIALLRVHHYLNAIDDDMITTWSSSPISDHWPTFESPTWGEVVSHTLSSLNRMYNNNTQAESSVKIPDGENRPPRRTTEQQIEWMQDYHRSAASFRSRIRLSRISRSLVVGSALTTFLVVVGALSVNAAMWRQFDMRPYNIAGGVFLAPLLAMFGIGWRMDTGQPEGEKPKSVAMLKLELDLLEERRILAAAQNERSLTDRQRSYRESIPQEIDRLRRETRYYRRVHNFFQWGLFAAAVTMSVTAAVYDPPQPGKAILIGLAAFVSFTTAVTGYFKFRERAFNLQQTSDAIDQQVTAYDLGINPYNQGDAAANLERLAETVESLRVEQRKREQQLEQPHQGQQEVI